jgi:flagellar motility protein MotE (MotC chaperone)
VEIPDTWASLLVSALKDAVTYNRQLLNSQTLKNRDEYEEHLMILNELFEHIKEEYKRKVESQGGISLDELL